ncbi:hypothetical protein Poli38472_009198 [Pythium oligandrum]|uniref:Glycine cleavage system H protein n=1 Tax=Pythium oligandrum TaxID=41045 RepID=A0A8K1CK06_PYTOL|nr:hypothetical protein Poli38472_009198 [Pythium oligandrum]|eukprot:TMW65031.1 hypothetical protein Poli38472_009198 [Pythium oligandrum]
MVMAIRAVSALSKSFRAPVTTAWRSASRAQQPAIAFFSTKYTPQHEYIAVNGKEGTIGITDFAQNQLGDVVYVDLPAVGNTFAKGDVFGAVESVKAASDVYAPVSGTVTAVNEELSENPHLVNEEAMTGGWFIKISLDNESELDELLDEAAYKEHCENEEH